MADTIRKQIIDAFVARAAVIRNANGYETEAGQRVLKAVALEDPDDAPFVNVWPQPETVTRVEGLHVVTMLVRVEATLLHGNDPVAVSEAALGDLIEAFGGFRWSVSFTSGGTYEVVVGDTVTVADSSAAGYVTGVTVSSGSWAGGDAAGTLELAGFAYFDPEFLNVGLNLNVCTVSIITYETPAAVVTGGLARDIRYRAGGVEGYPAEGNVFVGVYAEFEVDYATLIGNPYGQ